MADKLLADLIVIAHLGWILFMLAGFIFALCGFLRKEFFEWWLFRTLHLIGIAYVSTLAMLGEYCPLTTWENALRAKYDPGLTYPGSFMVHYFEKFIYPDVHPLIIRIPTTLVAVVTVLIFIIRPPEKIKRIFKQKKNKLGNHNSFPEVKRQQDK